jgi:ATP-dependent RNA helicase DeaD
LKTEIATTTPTTITASAFDQFNLSDELNRAISELGYTTATPIQLEALPVLLKGNTDFLGLASTGTGKTAAFSIPLLENLKESIKGVQSLILCPTRELAKQVCEQINLLARYKKTKAIAIYGGSDYGGQLRALKEGVSIVVGTPGRILDHLERGTLKLNSISTVILDEADEMISMGFKEEIETILKQIETIDRHQTWLFSATMSREVRKIADQFLTDPVQVQINKQEGVAPAVKQFYYSVREDDKPAVIERLMDQAPDFYGLIFCQTKVIVNTLTQKLKEDGYPVDCLHGDMEQNARERTLRAFKAKTVTVLVCTDVASRGIDVRELTHVVNYSLPRELDLYVHRIGRTGRAGKEGLAFNLVTPSHRGLISRIEKATNSKMTQATVPLEGDILGIKVNRACSDFEKLSENARLAEFKKLIQTGAWKTAIEELSKEEIVARFLAQTIKLKTRSVESMAAPAERGSDRGYRGGRSSEGSRGGSPYPRREGSSRGGFGGGASRGGFGGGRGASRGGERGAERAFGEAGSRGGYVREGFKPEAPKRETFGTEFKSEFKSEFKTDAKPAYRAKEKSFAAKGDLPAFDKKAAYSKKPAFAKSAGFAKKSNFANAPAFSANKKPAQKIKFKSA